MRQLKFKINDYSIRPKYTAAYLRRDEENYVDELRSAVIEEIQTDLELTIGEYTMHLAAWLDPGHWWDDWRDAFVANGSDIEYDEVAERVQEILAAAVVDK